MQLTLPALVFTSDELYEESGDAEAYGIAKLLCTYKFVACLYMLCDVLHVVAILEGSLQSKELDLALFKRRSKVLLKAWLSLKSNLSLPHTVNPQSQMLKIVIKRMC